MGQTRGLIIKTVQPPFLHENTPCASLPKRVIRHGQRHPRDSGIALVLHDVVLKPSHHTRLHSAEPGDLSPWPRGSRITT
jgi:hypothetical protein